MSYWMLGIGVTVVLTAVLGVLVSAMVGSQTLFGITNDHLANYATLLAVGFSRWQLIACVLMVSFRQACMNLSARRGRIDRSLLRLWTRVADATTRASGPPGGSQTAV